MKKQLSIICFVVAIIIFWSCGGDKSDNFGREITIHQNRSKSPALNRTQEECRLKYLLRGE